MTREEELVEALQQAITEIREHNAEYKYSTPENVLLEWEELVGKSNKKLLGHYVRQHTRD